MLHHHQIFIRGHAGHTSLHGVGWSILDKQHAKYDFQHEEEDGTVEGRDINNKKRLNI